MRLPVTLLMSSALFLSAGCNEMKNPFPGQGVTNDYRSYVPATAKKVASGTGNVSYTASAQGQVYVVDLGRTEQTTKETTAPYVIGSALLLKGQSVTVDGAAGKMTLSAVQNVSGITFSNKNLNAGSSIALYFEPSATQ
jgi:hypothetical protein